MSMNVSRCLLLMASDLVCGLGNRGDSQDKFDQLRAQRDQIRIQVRNATDRLHWPWVSVRVALPGSWTAPRQRLRLARLQRSPVFTAIAPAAAVVARAQAGRFLAGLRVAGYLGGGGRPLCP